jgi:DNA-binding winged helix-turn-helix (wHTH) protein
MERDLEEIVKQNERIVAKFRGAIQSKGVFADAEDPEFEKSVALDILAEVLQDIRVKRKSQYKLLGGTEELPKEIAFLQFEGKYCYVNGKKKLSDSNIVKTLFYFLEYEDEEFDSEEISNISGGYTHTCRQGIYHLRKLLREAEVETFKIITGNGNPRKYRIERTSREEKRNRRESIIEKVVKAYKQRIGEEFHGTVTYVREAVKDIMNNILPKYRILGGEEDLPNELYGIHFTQEHMKIGEKEYKINSVSTTLVVYLLENLGRAFSPKDIADVSETYKHTVRTNMSRITVALRDAEELGLEVFTERKAPTYYGIREKTQP